MAARLRVVDTSAWIEWLVGSAPGRKLGKLIPDKSHCIVPTIVQLELSKWLMREVGEDQGDQVIAYTQKCTSFLSIPPSPCLQRKCTASTSSPPLTPSSTPPRSITGPNS